MGKPHRAITGFLAWVREFVGPVYDHNHVALSKEWEEQLAFLQKWAVDDELNIPDITDDETLVRVIDELKYRIKGGKYNANGRSLTEDFDTALGIFIRENNLDGDPHTLASLPKTEKQ